MLASPALRRSSWYDDLRQHRQLLTSFALLLTLLVVGELVTGSFWTAANLRAMLLSASFLGIASVGQTLCAFVGAVDLSIAFVMSSANILFLWLLDRGIGEPLAVLLIAMGALLIGTLSGLLSRRSKGQAVIVTLGVGYAVLGLAQIITSIGSQYAGTVTGKVPHWLTNWSSLGGKTFGISLPPIVILWVGLSVAVIVFTRRTWLGRGLFALGGNAEAARQIAVPNRLLSVGVFAASALMAALAGVMLLGFGGGAFADVGNPFLFSSIVAVVVGGTSLLGGRGGYGLTVIGVGVLTELTQTLVGAGLSASAQQTIIGLILVPMVGLYARAPKLSLQI